MIQAVFSSYLPCHRLLADQKQVEPSPGLKFVWLKQFVFRARAPPLEHDHYLTNAININIDAILFVSPSASQV
jgi:hypothetical protein